MAWLQSFDRDQNGVLSRDEFEEFLSKMGVFLARQELRCVFDQFDANKDGNVCYAEFVNVLKVSQSDPAPPTALQLQFMI